MSSCVRVCLHACVYLCGLVRVGVCCPQPVPFHYLLASSRVQHLIIESLTPNMSIEGITWAPRKERLMYVQSPPLTDNHVFRDAPHSPLFEGQRGSPPPPLPSPPLPSAPLPSPPPSAFLPRFFSSVPHATPRPVQPLIPRPLPPPCCPMHPSPAHRSRHPPTRSACS